MIGMDIRPDVDAAKSALMELDIEIPKIQRALVQAIATGAKNYVKNHMDAYLGKGEGKFFILGSKGKRKWLTLKQRVYGYRRSESHAVVAAPRYIAEPLERGAVIRPKKAKTLAFYGANGFVRPKQVIIPAKHWFSRSLAGHEGSPEEVKAIENAEKRMEKKYGGAK